MRTLLFVGCLAFSICMCSCQKDNAHIINNKVKNPSSDAVSGSITGSWELRLWTGRPLPNYNPYNAPGNGNVWKFTDSTYQLYLEHELADSGNYISGRDTSEVTGQLTDFFTLKKNYDQRVFFEIKEDTLVIYQGNVLSCGTIQKYVRL